jgi:rsbT co-antagonist protein RsbR
MQQVTQVIRDRLTQYVEAGCQRVVDSGNPVYSHLPREILHAAVRRVFNAVVDDLENGGQPSAVPLLMGRIGAQRLQEGARISDILGGMAHGFDVISEDLEVWFRDDPAVFAQWTRALSRLSYAGAAALADTYMAARESVVRAQAEEIFRLSAPLLPLYPGILVLPLVGTLDDERATQVTMTMLSAIVAHASKVVLIDVTGMPRLDERVVKHLLTAGKAVRLIGARPVVVGLSPAVAKAVVAMGIELTDVRMLGDLGDGLKYALSLLGKAIVSEDGRRRQAPPPAARPPSREK